MSALVLVLLLLAAFTAGAVVGVVAFAVYLLPGGT